MRFPRDAVVRDNRPAARAAALLRAQLSSLRRQRTAALLLSVLLILAIAAAFRAHDRASVWDEETAMSIRLPRRVKSNNGNATNLAVFNALGRPSVLPVVLSNAVHHFLDDPDWSCLVLMYVGEDVLPSRDPRLAALNNICPVLRIPRVRWGNWLQLLHPTLLGRQYRMIAIVLDDLLLPVRGERRIDVPGLVAQMDEHGLASISPAIAGAERRGTRPRLGDDELGNCTVEVDGTVEIFFQIYPRETWECLYEMLDYRNSMGWCYDACLRKQCGGRHAIDYRMVAYHLETAGRDVPEAALAGLDELHPGWEKASRAEKGDKKRNSGVASDFDQSWDGLAICKRYECGLRDEYTMERSLECGPHR